MERNISIKLMDSYWGLLKNLSDDMKLKLIAKLSDSLVNRKVVEDCADLPDKYYGAWKDDKSAEELIDVIRSSRVLGTRQLETLE